MFRLRIQKIIVKRNNVLLQFFATKKSNGIQEHFLGQKLFPTRCERVEFTAFQSQHVNKAFLCKG